MVRWRRSRSDDLENELNRGAMWAVTYGDLMSYLMIFFLIMFSSNIGRASRGNQDVQVQKSLVSIQKVFGGLGSSPQYERAVTREKEESMVTQLKETMDRSSLSQYAQVQSWDKKIRLVLADKVLFSSGRAELKPESKAFMRQLAVQLKATGNPILIEGHTDNVPVRGGRYESNWELSMARAYAVLRELEAGGVPPERLSGEGYGEYRPVASNATAEGRAKNRRIEIDLIRAD